MQPNNPQAPPEADVARAAIALGTTTPLVSADYAGFWTRFSAVFLDGIFIGIFSGAVRAISGIAISLVLGDSDSAVAVTAAIGIVIWLIELAYPIYFIGTKGQTLGKMIMKIKVIKADTGATPDFVSAFLRETVGKFISSIVLGMGYMAAIKDPKKQAWHDRIAGTVVVKI
jgi:uncharacterized RDD family membrane protein YckC